MTSVLRFLLWSLLVACVWAEPKVVITVIGADKESTYQLAEEVRQVREQFQIGKDQLPIVRIPAAKLKPGDYQRIGFTRGSLPVIALMKVSSQENLEGVVGTTPNIFRYAKTGVLPAQVLLCRWCQLTGKPIPASLQNLSDLYQPNRVFILNVSNDSQLLQETAEKIRQAKQLAGVTEAELPVLSSGFPDGLLDRAEFARLGFVEEALPLVALVQMSESANPSRIVNEGILRWSYNPAWAAAKTIKIWGSLQGREISNISDESLRLQLTDLAAPKSPSPAWTGVVRNFRYGQGGRSWLQVSWRVTPDGPAQVRDFIQECPLQELPLQLPITSPGRPGNYLLEIEIRDKLGNQRFQSQLPWISETQ